jgi:hypothetical protein
LEGLRIENGGIFYVHLEYFTIIWYILRPFGYVLVIWYIFPRFGIMWQEKSGNPGIHQILVISDSATHWYVWNEHVSGYKLSCNMIFSESCLKSSEGYVEKCQKCLRNRWKKLKTNIWTHICMTEKQTDNAAKWGHIAENLWRFLHGSPLYICIYVCINGNSKIYVHAYIRIWCTFLIVW